MKAELDIDTEELEERVVQRVVKALKPLLCDCQDKGKGLLTAKALAEYLSVSESWVYDRVKFNEIPFYKVGGNLRFKRETIDRWLEEQCKTPAITPLIGIEKVGG